MRDFYKLDARTIALVIAILALASAVPAQPKEMYNGINDPETLVNKRMAHLPASLHLTTAERSKLRAAYLDLARYERKVIVAPGSMLFKRGEVGRFSRHTESRIRQFLSAAQYRELTRQPSSRFKKGTP